MLSFCSTRVRVPTSLLQIHSDAVQIRTPRLLILRHRLHPRLIRLKHQPLIAIPTSPLLPNWCSLQAVHVRIEAPNKTSPVPLHNRHYAAVGGVVAHRSTTIDTLHAPDGCHLDSVRDAVPGGKGYGIDYIPAVVPVAAHVVLLIDTRDVDAGADVPHLAIRIADLAPVSAGVVELLCDGIERVDRSQLRQPQRGKLILKESVGLTEGAGVLGREDCAFVRVITVNGGYSDEFAFGVRAVGIVGDEIVVEGRAVHVKRRVLCAWEGGIEVLLLEKSRVETAETCKSVVLASAAGANDKRVVCELALADVPESRE